MIRQPWLKKAPRLKLAIKDWVTEGNLASHHSTEQSMTHDFSHAKAVLLTVIIDDGKWLLCSHATSTEMGIL